jgi:hypothetical protein
MTDAGQMFSDGKTYERMMGRRSKLAGRIFLDWLDAPKDWHWVEVGCGNGAFTEELTARTAPRAPTPSTHRRVSSRSRARGPRRSLRNFALAKRRRCRSRTTASMPPPWR